jgi:hypothetical protein
VYSLKKVTFLQSYNQNIFFSEMQSASKDKYSYTLLHHAIFKGKFISSEKLLNYWLWIGKLFKKITS